MASAGRTINSGSDNRFTSADAIQQQILQSISDQLNAADLRFDSGELLYQNRLTDLTLEEGCNRTVILRMQTDVALQDSSALTLKLDSLFQPVTIELDLLADVSVQGIARQIVGIRLGKCRNLARDSFSISADGQLALSLSVSLSLNPEWTADSVLSLYPEFSLAAELIRFDRTIHVTDTLLRNFVEGLIEDEVESAFSADRIAAQLKTLELTLNNTVSAAFEAGRIDIELPPADDEQILNLYKLLLPDARFPITLDVIRQNRQALLASVVLGDDSAAINSLSDALLCQAGSAFMSSINHRMLYSLDSGECAAVNLAIESPMNLYDNADCFGGFPYAETSIAEYCETAMDKQRLGNPVSRPDKLNRWTLSPGSRFDISLLPKTGLPQAFMRREKYREIETHRGTCELEMRIYSSNPQAANQQPLLALHGGSWQHRASGAVGIEATASHFTNKGFVVFAPFYRLVGETDGNAECNQSSLSAILDDSNVALDWVLDNQSRFGAAGDVTLFGQSAGGHLALSLSVHRASDIRRSILFYAPSDFEDFAIEIQSGRYNNPAGEKILERVAGEPVESLNLDSALVQSNSFHKLVAAQASAIPPMFIVHGKMDELLPHRQSVRLCNALSTSGTAEHGPASSAATNDELVERIQCSVEGSELHLIAEGSHALDLCISSNLCLAGSEASAMAARDSMNTMLEWAASTTVDTRLLARNAGTGTIGWVEICYLWVFALIMLQSTNKRCRSGRADC